MKLSRTYTQYMKEFAFLLSSLEYVDQMLKISLKFDIQQIVLLSVYS